MQLITEKDVPYLEYETIREKVDAFLNQYHSSRELPIPIEEIVDLKLRINIFPLGNLQDGEHTVGFLYSNKKDIGVDEFVYYRRPKRFRFTLAHEIGHLRLHGHIYDKCEIISFKDWSRFINSIPERIVIRLEWQANVFAGLVLVPEPQFSQEVQRHVEMVLKQGPWESLDMVWSHIVKNVASSFDVSSDVINRRLEKSGLKRKYNDRILGCGR